MNAMIAAALVFGGLIAGAALVWLFMRAQGVAKESLARSELGGQILAAEAALDERTRRLEASMADAARYEQAVEAHKFAWAALYE